VQQWRRAAAARPDSVPIALDLSLLLATNPDVRNTGDAVRIAERANRITKNNDPAVLDVLAVAYAAEGRLELAARTAQLAMQRALAAKNDALAMAIRQRLLQYQEAMAGSADSTEP